MTNALTHYGQAVALHKDIRSITNFTANSPAAAGTGGITQIAAYLKLYVTGSSPAKANGASSYTEASGTGYAAKAITASDWNVELSGGNYQIRLNDQTWTAGAGGIANVAGAYLTDSAGNVMAWWERSSEVDLASGEQITADDLIIRLG